MAVLHPNLVERVNYVETIQNRVEGGRRAYFASNLKGVSHLVASSPTGRYLAIFQRANGQWLRYSGGSRTVLADRQLHVHVGYFQWDNVNRVKVQSSEHEPDAARQPRRLILKPRARRVAQRNHSTYDLVLLAYP